MGEVPAGLLLTEQETAELFEVTVSALHVWRKRRPDAPKPRKEDGRNYFLAGEVVAWRHRIPARSRKFEEPDGFTYGQRARRALALRSAEPCASVRHVEEEIEGRLEEFLGPLATRVRGGASLEDYLLLVFSCIFLSRSGGRRLGVVRDLVNEASSEQSDPRRLLAELVRHIDDALRENGIPPGVGPTLMRLRPESPDDVHQVVRLCAGFGPKAFEALLDRFEESTRPRGGELFTPKDVTHLMVGVLKNDDRGEGLGWYDPYPRAGECLVAAIRDAGGRQMTAEGSVASLRLAGMNLVLHDADIHVLERAAEPWRSTDQPPRLFDRVLANPPFNAKPLAGSRLSDQDWPFGPPPASRDNYAWLQYVVSCLKPTGRAAVVMPTKAMASEQREERAIRQKMIERGVVECIVALPGGLFATTRVAVTVWFLTAPNGPREQVLLIDASALGHGTGGRRHLADGNIDAISACAQAWREGRQDFNVALPDGAWATSVSIAEMQERRFSLAPIDYRPRPNTPAPALSPDSRPHPVVALDRLRADAETADTIARTIQVSERAPFNDHLPPGWTERPLGEVCDIQPAPGRRPLSMAERCGTGVPVITPGNIRERRIVELHGADAWRIEERSAERLSRYRLEPRDILCVRTGSIGPVAMADAGQHGWVQGDHVHRIRVKPSADLDPYYLLALLSLPSSREWINGRAAMATAVKFINGPDLRRLPVRLPPPHEQHAIGAALRDLDAQIIAHRDLANAAERLRAGLGTDLINGLLIRGY